MIIQYTICIRHAKNVHVLCEISIMSMPDHLKREKLSAMFFTGEIGSLLSRDIKFSQVLISYFFLF